MKSVKSAVLKIAMKKNAGRHHQAGLTLIELLIALGLGIFLVAGIVQIFIGSRQAFEVIHAQSAMQEAGRVSISFIGTSMRQTGYLNVGEIDPANGDEYAQILLNIVNSEDLWSEQWPAAGVFGAGAVVAGSDSADGVAGLAAAKPGVDAVSFRLQRDPDATTRDCEGRQLLSDDPMQMTYYVDNNDQLRCTSSGGGLAPNSAILVSGVEDMQVLYGVASAASPSQIGEYVSAGSVADWGNVLAVRIGLLGVSDNAPLDTQGAQLPDYQVLDKAVADPADGKARQLFQQTIAFRNKLSD